MSRLAGALAEMEARDAAAEAALTTSTDNTNTNDAAADAAAVVTQDAAAGDAAATPAKAEAAAAVDPGAAAAKPTEAQQALWDKRAQEWDQERANLSRAVNDLTKAVGAQGGKPTPEQAQQAEVLKDSLADLDAMIAGDFDSFEQSKPAFKALVSEMRADKKRIADLEKRLGATEESAQQRNLREQEEARAAAVWADFGSKNPSIDGPKIFQTCLTELQAKGYQGERLAGAVDALFDIRVTEAKAAATAKPAAATTSTNSTNAASTAAPGKTAPAAAGITPGDALVSGVSGAAPRTVRKSPQQAIDDGDVDFFGGRFSRS